MKNIVLIASLCGLALGANRVDPLVSTKAGLIRGLRDENGYAKFLGVPYGKVGNNIFGVAEPHPGFDDVFEANDDSNICVQRDNRSGMIMGTIDCLNMNIYVPDSANSENRLPVMVWIHGGAFISDNFRDAGRNSLSLFRYDVIVVTIQYRVGVFGFMCLDIPEVPGNTGLKDQVLALRWINENIEAFGGDSNLITIFGGSAGGMSTNLHLFSSYEKLFTRAIIQSGPANSYWTMVKSDTTIPFRIAAELGFNATDINEALTFLSEVNTHTLAQTAFDLGIADSTGTKEPLTKPCVEQQFEGVEHFITEHPMNIKSNKYSTIPVMIGITDTECAFQYANVEAEFFDTFDFDHIFAMGFDMDKDLSEALENVKHFFIAEENISEKVKWQIIDFESDLIFNHPTQRMAQIFMQNGFENVYRYIYSYGGSDGNMNKTWSGASHGEEVRYLFDANVADSEKSPEDRLMVDRLTQLWTNFAKYGDPTPTTSEILPVKWTPITATKQYYLQIDLELSLKSRPFQDRMAYWDLFYLQYGHYQKWSEV